MADIFVGYASEDVDRVRTLVQLMSAQGWSVWWDHKIPIGKSFDVVIEGELARAACVVVVWSKASVGSEWVKNEAYEGKRRNILVPAIIDEAAIPFEFRRVETAKLHDWDYQSTSHPELHEFFSAIGGIIQRPWTLDENGTASDRRDDEPEQSQATEAPEDVPAARMQRMDRPVASEQQRRAKRLLARWFTWNRIPNTVFREARQLVDRAPVSVEDQDRMTVLEICGSDDGALFTRAWQALDRSPQVQRTPLEQLEAFLTLHLAHGELDETTYRHAMATLGHEPQGEHEARRHEVLTRFAENDDWDISFFDYLWKEMEEETAPALVPDWAEGRYVSDLVTTSSEIVSEPAGWSVSGGGAAPPAVEESVAFDSDSANESSDETADVPSGGTTGEFDAGTPTPDGGDSDTQARSDPDTLDKSVLGRRKTVFAVGIIAALATILGIIRPWDRVENGDEGVAVTTADTAPPVTPLMVDSATVTPPVFLDSIRSQLTLGRRMHDNARYAAAAEVVDEALRRLRSRAAELPEQERQALEDSLKSLRSATRTACAAEDSSRTRIDEAGAPCPQ
jgi:hypothetical protein